MKTTTLIAASDAKVRRALARSLGAGAWPAADADEVLRRAAEDRSSLLLVWNLEPGGEFDLGPLEAVRATRPLLPVLVLDPGPPRAGGRTLRLGGLTFLFRPFSPAALRREAAHLRAQSRCEAPRATVEVLEHALDRLSGARSLFEHLPVAATVTDPRGRVLAANAEARRLAGGAPSPTAGQTCRAYWGCTVSVAHCPLRRALRTGKTVYHARVRTGGPDGERTVVERVSTWRSPAGRRALVVTGVATAFFRRLQRLRRDASTDLMTSVLNRGRFDELIARSLRNERRDGPRAFIMMDIDGLKIVNDRFGHAAGDRLLRRLGRVLGENTRRTDLVGRVGGDEFAIFCPDTSRARAHGLVRRLRRALAADNAQNAREPRLSVQFGQAFSRGPHRADLRERADADLYRRKRRHRLGRPERVRKPPERRGLDRFRREDREALLGT
jgi:diguanylate cyclase (GGDEF)-like protein